MQHDVEQTLPCSHEHCEVNYLGRLEIIHFENIVGTRSSGRRISGVDSSGTTPGGGLGDTPYFNSLRIVVGTQRRSCIHTNKK